MKNDLDYIKKEIRKLQKELDGLKNSIKEWKKLKLKFHHLQNKTSPIG